MMLPGILEREDLLVTGKSRSIVDRESELSFVHDFILSISERATALVLKARKE
jgi:hypothetical protein